MVGEFKYTKSQETFDYLINTLKDTVNGWTYFVNWAKVNKNINNVEISLNILNCLIGKDNIMEEFKRILKHYPETLVAIPILVASREKSFKILNPKDDDMFNLDSYDFTKYERLSNEQVEKVLEFVDKSGVLEIIQNKRVKSLVDYVYGIEVGLDSNGRKNRSGTAMEDLVEIFIKRICQKHNYQYMKQATQKDIKNDWGYSIEVDKATRRFDFAISANKKLFLIETNYYSDSGSKLKATAGEYKTLYDYITKNGHEFIWITDGKGWVSTTRPLQETFEHNKYIFNLDMVEKGALEKVVEGKDIV